jgi:hypothetical protein
MRLYPLPILASLLTAWPRLAAAQFDCLPLPSPSLTDTSIAGVVVERSSGRPVPQVFIELDGGPLGFTDCDGRFGLPYNVPDGKHVVSTWSPYFKRQSQRINVAGPVVTRVSFRLDLLPPAAPPAIDLAGDWILTLFKDTAPDQPIAAGPMSIRPRATDRLGTSYTARLHLDYRLLGVPQSFVDSFPEFSPGPVEDSLPVHAARDSVSISLTPRIIDGGWSFRGRIRGQAVVGYWCAHDFAHDCTRVGRAPLGRP